MSLLHTTERDNESHSCTMRSKPAVRNWANVGWGHKAHSSSVCPMTAGLKPIDSEPIRMQFRVDPTSNCDPRPSDTVRMPPKCSATCVQTKLRNVIVASRQLIERHEKHRGVFVFFATFSEKLLLIHIVFFLLFKLKLLRELSQGE